MMKPFQPPRRLTVTVVLTLLSITVSDNALYSGDLLFREEFDYLRDRDSGRMEEHPVRNRYGWRWASWEPLEERFLDGSASRRTRISGNSGMPPDGEGAEASAEGKNFAEGHLLSTGAPGGNEIYFYERLPLNVSALSDLSFRFFYNNDEPETLRALIAVSGAPRPPGWMHNHVDWYVTEEVITAGGEDGWTEENVADFNFSRAAWRRLNVSRARGDNRITVGGADEPPKEGYILAFGLLVERKQGRVRIDNFEVGAEGGGAGRARDLDEEAFRWAEADQVTHHDVYSVPGKYATFPSLFIDPNRDHLYANFTVRKLDASLTWDHIGKGDDKIVHMESRDGGRSWREIPEIPADAEDVRPGHRLPSAHEGAPAAGAYLTPEGSLIRVGQRFHGGAFEVSGGALVRIGERGRRWHPNERLGEFEGKYRVTPAAETKAGTGPAGPDHFAVTSGGFMERSEVGGESWLRTDLPELDTWVSLSSPWSYAQLPDGTVMQIFMVLEEENAERQVYAVSTKDGLSAEVTHVMGEKPGGSLRFTEETLLHVTSDGAIWMLTRVHGGSEQWWQAVSSDGGRSWEAGPTDLGGFNTPPSGLVELDDGRLVLVYGKRSRPELGIVALVSEDEGLTWRTDRRIALRLDGDGADLGYPIAARLSDGTVVAVYYYRSAELTDRGSRAILATRFKVPAFQ